LTQQALKMIQHLGPHLQLAQIVAALCLRNA